MMESAQATNLATDLVREENMLRRKAAILEEFLRNDGCRLSSAEERCETLKKNIVFLENEIAMKGKTDRARQYLYYPPEAEFGNVRRDEFLGWLLERGQSLPAYPENVRAQSPSKRGAHLTAVNSDSDDSVVKSPIAHRSKRARILEKEKSPCLRCRILKKRCDALEMCAHCPSQSYDNDNDFWKVLGCFRGHLKEFSTIFCPDFSRSATRIFKYKTGNTEVINFVLTKSGVSAKKRQRILYLVDREEFSQLSDTFWEDTSKRETLTQAALGSVDMSKVPEIFPKPGFNLEDFEAIWSIISILSMEPKYFTKTEYNLFALIRQGNRMAAQETVAWDIYNHAKRLLRQSTEIYLLERLCGEIASGNAPIPTPLDKSKAPNTLTLVDLRPDFESFLHKFEKLCSARSKLSGTTNLACFYALLVFGIAKSILIDSYSVRDRYESPSSWSEEEATRITSAYKALVGVYCWSSKSDIMLHGPSENLQDLHRLVNYNRWGERGYKGSKEFLLSLGSCTFSDGSYNGFFVQNFGFHLLPTALTQVPASYQHYKSQLGIRDSSPNRSLIHTLGSNSNIVSPGSVTWPENTPSPPPNQGPSPSVKVSSTVLGPGTEDSDDDRPRKHGGRKGALDPEVRRNAREVRMLRACWNCKVMQIKCSPGVVCEPCQKREGTKSYQLCNRSPFMAFTDLLFPRYVTSEFGTEAAEAYKNKVVDSWSKETISVAIVWGAKTYILFDASIFQPVPGSRALESYNGWDGQPLGVESLPVGIPTDGIKTLGNVCTNYVESLLETASFLHVASSRNDSTLSSLILEVVSRFYEASTIKNPLLRDLLLLCLEIRLMSRPFVLTTHSADLVLRKLDAIPNGNTIYSSRLLNRQVKSCIYNSVRRTTAQVLTQSDKLVQSRDKALWPTWFSAMLLLCLCIEQVQIMADAHTHAAKLSDPSLDDLDDEPKTSCQALDEMVYGQLEHIFHVHFRTMKGGSGAINPFRDDLASIGGLEFDDATKTMVSEIKEKVLENIELLQERNKPPSFDKGPEEFSKSNSGRLLSRFLSGFVNTKEK